MPEFLRDPNLLVTVVIGIATLCLTAVGILVTIRIYRSQRKYKELTYENPPALKLVSVEKGFESEIEVRFQGNRVRTLVSESVTIENTGTEPITKADYEEPIRVFFGNRRARIFQAGATLDTGMEERDLPVTVNWPNVEIEPTLLNPGDRLRVGAFLTRSEGKITVTGRIAGVREITRKAQAVDRALSTRDFRRKLLLLSLLPITFLAINLVIFDRPEGGRNPWWFDAVVWAYFVGMLAVFLSETLALRKSYRTRRS
jgi:hypothetical protein